MRLGFVVFSVLLLWVTTASPQSQATVDAGTSFPTLVTSVKANYTPEAKAAACE